MYYSKNMWKLIYLAYARKKIHYLTRRIVYSDVSTTIPRIFRFFRWRLFRVKTKEMMTKKSFIRNKLCGYPLYAFFPRNRKFTLLKRKNYLIRNKLSLWRLIVAIMKASPLRKKKKKGGKKKK